MGYIKLESCTCSPHDMQSFSYPSVAVCNSACDNYIKNVNNLHSLLKKIDNLIYLYGESFKIGESQILKEKMQEIKEGLDYAIDRIDITAENIDVIKNIVVEERKYILDAKISQARSKHNDIAANEIENIKWSSDDYA